MPFSGNIYIENFNDSSNIDVSVPQHILNWLSEPSGGTLDNSVTRNNGETFQVQKASTLLDDALNSGRNVSFGNVDISGGITTGSSGIL